MNAGAKAVQARFKWRVREPGKAAMAHIAAEVAFAKMAFFRSVYGIAMPGILYGGFKSKAGKGLCNHCPVAPLVRGSR